MGKREGRRGKWEEMIWAYWEGSFMGAVFQPPLGLIRIGLGPGTLPYQGVFTACAGLTTSCGSSLFCFTLNVHSFALPMWHMAPGQPHCYNSSLQKGDGVLCSVAQEGCPQANSPVSAAGRDLLTVAWCPLLWLILSVSLLYARRALFQHSTVLQSTVLDCVGFPLVTPIPRYSGQKCLDFCSWRWATDATCSTDHMREECSRKCSVSEIWGCVLHMFKKEMASRITEGVE